MEKLFLRIIKYISGLFIMVIGSRNGEDIHYFDAKS